MTTALWLAWPIATFTTWGLFALRIGMRHDASMDDLPERGENE